MLVVLGEDIGRRRSDMETAKRTVSTSDGLDEDMLSSSSWSGTEFGEDDRHTNELSKLWRGDVGVGAGVLPNSDVYQIEI